MSGPIKTLRVALAQINTTVGDLDGNAAKVIDYAERARELGADVVAFPELTLTGYPPEDLLLRRAFIARQPRAPSKRVAAACAASPPSSASSTRDADIYNAAAVIHDGALAGVYHKQFLPNYGVFDEKRYFRAGDDRPGLHDRRRARRREHLRGHLVPGGPDAGPGAGRRRRRRSTSTARPSTPASAASASAWSPRAPPITPSSSATSTSSAARTSCVFDGNSVVFDQDGELLARAPVLRGGPARRRRQPRVALPRPPAQPAAPRRDACDRAVDEVHVGRASSVLDELRTTAAANAARPSPDQRRAARATRPRSTRRSSSARATTSTRTASRP